MDINTTSYTVPSIYSIEVEDKKISCVEYELIFTANKPISLKYTDIKGNTNTITIEDVVRVDTKKWENLHQIKELLKCPIKESKVIGEFNYSETPDIITLRGETNLRAIKL